MEGIPKKILGQATLNINTGRKLVWVSLYLNLYQY